MDAPKGYTHDPQSGKYYHVLEVTDPVSGATARLVSWFDPQTGSYTRAAEQTGGNPAPQPQSIAAPAPSRKQPAKKLLPLVGIGVAALLLIAGGVAVWQFDLLDGLFAAPPASSEPASSAALEPSSASGSEKAVAPSSSEKSTASSTESSQSLPKASDFVRGGSSSSSPYTAPTSAPDGLKLNSWYNGYIVRDGNLVLPLTRPLVNFWNEGRVTINYDYMYNDNKSMSGTNMQGSYRIEGNKIICTIHEFMEEKKVLQLTPADIPELVFEVTADGLTCDEEVEGIPFDDVIFHPETW